MKLKVLTALITSSILSANVQADEMAELRAQLQILKAQVDQLQTKIEQQSITTPSNVEQGNERHLLHNVADSIEISGAIEVEAFRTDNATLNDASDNSDTSDIAVATVELGIDAQITQNVSGHLLFLYEEDDSEFDVDEASITFSNLMDSPLYFTAGRVYVPFGNFESNMISDPLTLELAETSETVFQLGLETEWVYGSVYIFNGDSKSANDDDKVGAFGANLGFSGGDDHLNYDFGLDYINNIGDSDALTDELNNNIGANNLDNKVAAWSAHAIVSMGEFELMGEYITAVDEFEAGEIDSSSKKREPHAWNVEAAYNFSLAGKEAIIAAAYQETDDYLAQPEEAVLVSLGWGIYDNTSISLEWKHAEDYSISSGGTGDDADTITMQIAAEF